MRHSSKLKRFTYWQARFTTEPYEKTLQHWLNSAFAGTKVRQRLRPADAEENYQLPAETASEIIQTLASISAISGSLVGWSSNWIAQSRSIIRDIDNNTADDLFHQLGDFQKELIWRWGILFFSSILAITLAVLAKTPILSKIWLLTFSSGFLFVSRNDGYCSLEEQTWRLRTRWIKKRATFREKRKRRNNGLTILVSK